MTKVIKIYTLGTHGMNVWYKISWHSIKYLVRHFHLDQSGGLTDPMTNNAMSRCERGKNQTNKTPFKQSHFPALDHTDLFIH